MPGRGRLVNATVREQLPWLPPEGTVWHVEAGTHFDAVRAGRTIGLAALAELGDDCGPVICDPWTRIHYFLTEPASTGGWDVRETTACGAATYVVVPPLNARESDLHWVRQPSAGLPFTPPERLRHALQTAVDTMFGPRTGAR